MDDCLFSRRFFVTALKRTPFAILCVVSGEIVYYAIAFEHKQMVYHFIHEITVVTYDYDTAGEVGQILFKYLQSLYVKVICRLIKHQEVRIFISTVHKYSLRFSPPLNLYT